MWEWEWSLHVALMLVFLAFGIYFWLENRRWRMSVLQRNGIPGPKPHLLWGNLNEYLRTPNVVWDSQLIEKYGPVCGYYLGGKPKILISDPALVKKVLGCQTRPRLVPKGIKADPKRAKMLGNLPVEEWSKLRGTLDKGFSSANLQGMAVDVAELSRGFVSHLTPTDDSTNFYPLFQNFTLDLIGRAGFGVHSNIQDNPDDALKAAVEQEFSKSTGSFLLRFYLCCPELSWILQPIRVGIEIMKQRLGLGGPSALWDLGAETVANRRRIMNMNKGNAFFREPADLLAVMMRSTMDQDSIVANSVLFFEAGFETMSAGLAFITYNLIKHPEFQAHLRGEIQEILAQTDGNLPNLEILDDFKNLKALINESLRMFPPQTTFIGRSCMKDITHTYTWNDVERQCTIPKGIHIQVGLYQILNSEEFWPAPREFDPERFYGDDDANKTVFQPFGGGRRRCIGEKYAMMALKMVLIKMLSTYRLEASDATENEIEVVYKTATMTPKNGVFGKVVRDPLFP